MTDGRRTEADDSRRSSELPPELVQRLGALREQIRANCTHYELLGVPRNADRKTIKRSYYELAALVHPDRHGGRNLGDWKPLMEALFRHVTLAHDTLGDPTLRRHYDETLPPAPELPLVPPAPPSARQVDADPPPSARMPPPSARTVPASTRTPIRIPTPAPTPQPVSGRIPTRIATPVSVRVPVPVPNATPAPTPQPATAPSAPRRPLTAPTPVSAHWPTSVPRIATPVVTTPSEASRRDALARRLLAGRPSSRRQDTAATPNGDGPAEVAESVDERITIRETAEADEFQNEFTSAVRSWRKLRVLDPKNPDVAHRTARSILRSKDPNLHEAAELAKKAVQEAPRDYRHHLLLAEIYLEAQLPSAARSVIEHALALGEGATELTALLARVEARHRP